MNNDVEHLRLLSVFHYVVGALAALFSLFPVIHLIVGVAMFTGSMTEMQGQGDARIVGLFFIAVASAVIVCGLAFAVCVILTGRFLARRVHYTFCFVMAAVECMFMPFGTVLGVFTIVVLQRPGVKQLFQQSAEV